MNQLQVGGMNTEEFVVKAAHQLHDLVHRFFCFIKQQQKRYWTFIAQEHANKNVCEVLRNILIFFYPTGVNGRKNLVTLKKISNWLWLILELATHFIQRTKPSLFMILVSLTTNLHVSLTLSFQILLLGMFFGNFRFQEWSKTSNECGTIWIHGWVSDWCRSKGTKFRRNQPIQNDFETRKKFFSPFFLHKTQKRKEWQKVHWCVIRRKNYFLCLFDTIHPHLMYGSNRKPILFP